MKIAVEGGNSVGVESVSITKVCDGIYDVHINTDIKCPDYCGHLYGADGEAGVYLGKEGDSPDGLTGVLFIPETSEERDLCDDYILVHYERRYGLYCIMLRFDVLCAAQDRGEVIGKWPQSAGDHDER